MRREAKESPATWGAGVIVDAAVITGETLDRWVQIQQDYNGEKLLRDSLTTDKNTRILENEM
jgi:hypothetical protein